MRDLKKEAKGSYTVGIYAIEKRGKQWEAYAFGPGTLGDGFIGMFKTLREAYRNLTGEQL